MKYDSKSLKDDLLDFGLVYEHLPKYISSEGLSKAKISNTNIIPSSPDQVMMRKSDGGFRTVSLPNPVSYCICVNNIFDDDGLHNKLLQKIERNEFSLSKVLDKEKNVFRIPIKRPESTFTHDRKKKMILSIGKRYCVELDIERFYDNIYTHYLPAGLLGFKKARDQYKNREPRDNKYNYMTNLDKACRSMCNNETNGLITGPFTSRIMSELLLSEIDKEIIKKFKEIPYLRYFDDYTIYALTREEAENYLSSIRKIINKYKLNLNSEKTSIFDMPLFDFNPIYQLIKAQRNKNNSIDDYSMLQDDLFSIVHQADMLQRSGKRGILGYALKAFRDHNDKFFDDKKQSKISESVLYLINYLYIYPHYAGYITDILYNHLKDNKHLESLLNDTLRNFIRIGDDFTCLHLIELILRLDIDIEKDIALDYLMEPSQNSILQAVFLSYILDFKLIRKNNRVLNHVIDICKDNNGVNFTSDNWLSKYTLYYNDLITKDDFTDERHYNIFKKIKNSNIKFIDFFSMEKQFDT